MSIKYTSLLLTGTAAATAVAVGMSFHNTISRSPDTAPETAISLGMTPESLTLAGLEASDARRILAAIGADEDSQLALAAACTAGEEASTERTRAEARLANDGADEVTYGDWLTAEAALEDAREDLNGLRTQFAEEMLSGYATGTYEQIQAYSSWAGHELPAAFRCLEWNQPDMRKLAVAYRQEQRATRRHEDVPDEAAQLLTRARSDNNVIRAEVLLQTHLAEVEAEFN